MTQTTVRRPGFYWVRVRPNEALLVAEWSQDPDGSPGDWYVAGNDTPFGDARFDFISDRLQEPTP